MLRYRRISLDYRDISRHLLRRNVIVSSLRFLNSPCNKTHPRDVKTTRLRKHCRTYRTVNTSSACRKLQFDALTFCACYSAYIRKSTYTYYHRAIQLKIGGSRANTWLQYVRQTSFRSMLIAFEQQSVVSCIPCDNERPSPELRFHPIHLLHVYRRGGIDTKKYEMKLRYIYRRNNAFKHQEKRNGNAAHCSTLYFSERSFPF